MHSKVLRLPKLPQSQTVDVSSLSEKLQAASLLTKDAFAQRLYRFSRINFDFSQSPDAFVQLHELLSARVKQVSPKVLHEHMHLAHVAGLHQMCVDLFFQSIQTENCPFMLSEYAIDSAYGLKRISALKEMALYVRKKCLAAKEIGRRELLAEFALLRVFWRMVCLVEIYSCESTERGSFAIESSKRLEEETGEVWHHIAQSFPDESSVTGAACSTVLSLTRRLIKYDPSGDDGEMVFLRECMHRNFLVPPRPRDAISSSAVSSILSSEISAVELFYSVLISSCTAGQHTSTAMSYYETTQLLLSDDPSKFVDEYVLYRLLAVLQASKENELIVRLARSLLSAGASMSISVWSIVLISAGEVRARDVATQAYHIAMAKLDETSPASSDRRGDEYLLQTAVNALSKCQVPLFEADFLKPARESGALNCTDEFFMCCLLQEAHNSMNPVEKASEIRFRIEATGVPLTERIVSCLLKVYLRTESEEYVPLYLHATKELDLFRKPWLDGLLLWGDRRRYSLDNKVRKLIVDEVYARLGPKAMDYLGGLRTQCALLEYDLARNPSEHFLKFREPPAVAPTVQDPRSHFLTRRPLNTVRGLQGNPLVCLSSDYVASGDRNSKGAVIRIASASCTPLALGGDDRQSGPQVFLGEVLRAVQCDFSVV